MTPTKKSSGAVAANRNRKILQLTKTTSTVKRNRKSPRLYMKATLAGYTRGLHGQNKNTALVRIENVNTTEDAKWYVGKRVCYVYHGYKMKRCVRWSKAPVRRSNTRAIWGRVKRPHGNSGIVRVKFNGASVPASAIGKRVRVYLYPSRI
ncbi:putative Ribosomal protein L35Ae [Trypanosoma vivax]|uniref:Putative ribosomal protein l35a n=1 Tax=Trypanosoma vivax (strain Y486) TaxID=1055687 RepID=G0TU98_TRYVY|nr:60S ribosomal protein L35A [Trypanosoma vivax]KAH8607455.1 putative Ribosomal protein L35Ae [Trypanosoma vivax]CCC47532.1 putative ribosomal protein l35a [Trypanosoma vivax Y486]